MFKSVFGVSVVMAAGLFFAVSVQVAQGQEVSEADIRGLSGYKSYSTLGSFTERLRQDPALFGVLQSNEALAERILGSTMAQRQVLSKIESSGDVQQALSEFSEGTEANSFSSRRTQAESPELDKTRASQSVSDSNGNGNLAAQRAIERAQREREAANQRANDIMVRAREMMNREQSPEELARQQEEIIASNEAVAAVMAELADQPEALQAFLSDGALVQKVMDKAVTLSEALAQVGADINKDTASAGDAAVAENDTPVTTPPPDSLQQSLDDLLSTLKQVNPQAHTLLSQDSALQDSVLSGDITFDELLAELTTRLEQVASSPDPSLSPDPVPTHPSEPADDELVHVSGNKYQIDGRDVYDLNHIPTEDEMVLDAGGWPKFLNVPAECGPKNDDVTHFFEHRYGSGEIGNSSSRKSGAAMDRVALQSILHRQGPVDTGLTDDETLAAPFVVPNFTLTYPNRVAPLRADYIPAFLLPDQYTGVRGGFFAVSISYCPDDWEGVVPEGEKPLLDGCHLTHRTLSRTPYVLYLKIKELDAPAVFRKARGKLNHCVIEPGKRYFLNIAPAHRVDPEVQTFMERKLERYERLTSRYPEDYPLTAQEHLQQFLENPQAPIRNGKFIGSASTYGYGAGPPLAKLLPLPPNLSPDVNGDNGRHPLKLSDKGNFYKLADLKAGRNRPAPQCTSAGGKVLLSRTCYDPHGKLPTKRLVLECSGPGKATWVEGYNEKLFSHYVCVDTADGANTKRMGGLCLSENEGAFRRVEYKNPRLSRNPSTNTIEQCQFDKARGRFDWIAVEARPSSKDLGGHPNHNRVVYSQTADIPPRRSCVIGDKVVQLGDDVTMTCPNVTGSNISDSSFSYTLSCQQVADEPALPALVNENGYNINRMVTDPESSIGVESLLSWLPQCEIE